MDGIATLTFAGKTPQGVERMLRVTIRQKHPNASYLLRFNSTMIEQSVKMFGLTDLVIVAFDPLRYKVTTAPLDKIH